MSDIEYGLEGVRIAVLVAMLLAGLCALRRAIVINWRQDIFLVRNRLWDAMRETGCLDTQVHRRLRRDFNALLRVGPNLNIISFWLILRSLRKEEMHRLEPVDAHELPVEAQDAIVLAQSELVRLIINRIFYDTFPGCVIGWPAWAAFRVLRLVRFSRRAVDRIAKVIRSHVIEWAQDVEPAATAAERHQRKAITC